MEELADKLGLVQTFYFSRLCVFLLFSSVLRECHCTKSAMLQITVCFDLMQIWRLKERVCQLFEGCQHEFDNLVYRAKTS